MREISRTPAAARFSASRDDGFKAAAAEFSAQLRNHAESAGVVAAFVDFDVGGVAGRGENARRRVVIKVGGKVGGVRIVGAELAFARCEDFLDFAGADHGVNFRDLLADVVAIAFDHAAGDDQFLRAPEFFVFGHFQDRVHGLFLRGLDEAAGVDDEHVGLARARREFVAGARKNAHHHLAIHEVLGASQADESNFRHAERSFGCYGTRNSTIQA